MSDQSLEKSPSIAGKPKPQSKSSPMLTGFRQVTPKIFVYEPPSLNSSFSTPSHGESNHRGPESDKPAPPPPTTIILFAWSDGLPRHVERFTDAYKTLYATARIIVVLSTSTDITFASRQSAMAAMMPVVALLSSSSSSSSSSSPSLRRSSADEKKMNPEEGQRQDNNNKERILIHILSNGGCVNFSATCAAYYTLFARALPHTLLVLDSAPGGPHFVTEMRRWARGLSLGILPALPMPIARMVPSAFLDLVSMLWLGVTVGVPEVLLGRENAVSVARRSIAAGGLYADPAAGRLYIYSVADEVCGWEEIERHAAGAEERGLATRRLKFEDSPHVSHMKRYRREYWQAVTGAWDGAVVRARI